eukprot:13752217-Alexandrium_andersonii.AAC.1
MCIRDRCSPDRPVWPKSANRLQTLPVEAAIPARATSERPSSDLGTEERRSLPIMRIWAPEAPREARCLRF